MFGFNAQYNRPRVWSTMGRSSMPNSFTSTLRRADSRAGEVAVQFEERGIWICRFRRIHLHFVVLLRGERRGGEREQGEQNFGGGEACHFEFCSTKLHFTEDGEDSSTEKYNCIFCNCSSRV